MLLCICRLLSGDVYGKLLLEYRRGKQLKKAVSMYNKRTIFDIVLPRLMARDMIYADELAGLGEGGLCLNCDVCTFPNCGFGKGF